MNLANPKPFVRPGQGPGSGRGSVLICVLIVLSLTGMMAMQGTRLLLATARARGTQARLEQCQELLSLGRIRLTRQLQRSSDYQGETLTVEIAEALAAETPAAEAAIGEIRIEKMARQEGRGEGWRIIASAPLDQPGQMVAQWESEQ